MPAFPMNRSDIDNLDDPTTSAAPADMQLDSTNAHPIPPADPSPRLPGRYRVSRERILRERAAEERLICDIAHLRLENAAYEAELDDSSKESQIPATDSTPCPHSAYELSERSSNFLGVNLICPHVALTLLELIAYRRNMMEDGHRRSYRRPVTPTLLSETVRRATQAFADEADGDEMERNLHVRGHLRMLLELHERWAVLEMTGEAGDSSDDGDGEFVVSKQKKKRPHSKFSARKCPRGKRRTHAGTYRGWGVSTPDASLDERSGGDERPLQRKESEEWTAWANRTEEGKGSEEVQEQGEGMDAVEGV